MYQETQAQVTDEEILAADSHHYLAREKVLGQFFAKKTAPSDPALVRALVVDEKALRLKSDPAIPRQGRPNPDVKRTRRTIPSQNIAKSKRAPAGPEGPVFQEALRRKGVEVSERIAALLLKEVLSSSEDDFNDADAESDSDSDFYRGL